MKFDAVKSVSASADELTRWMADHEGACRDLAAAINRDANRGQEAAAMLAATARGRLEVGALMASIERDAHRQIEAPVPSPRLPKHVEEPTLVPRLRLDTRLMGAAISYYESRAGQLADDQAASVDEQHGFKHPRPQRWGGDLISHRTAALILQYRSGHTQCIASGNTLRKAIEAAPEGDPLAELRDTANRRAKDPKSGKLRRQAVEWVAREHGVDVDKVYREVDIGPAAPRSSRKRGKAGSARAPAGE